MRKLKIDEDIPAGGTTDITITPDAAGSFVSICDNFYGANHLEHGDDDCCGADLTAAGLVEAKLQQSAS